MIAPIRPRATTIAAVFWLYVGPSWVFAGSVMVLTSVALVEQMPGMDYAALDILPLFFLALLVCGLFGIAGALRLLALHERGRDNVERASWAAVTIIMVFTLRWAYGTAMFSYGRNTFLGTWDRVGPAVGGMAVGALAALPFLLTALMLRKPAVRSAIRSAQLRG